MGAPLLLSSDTVRGWTRNRIQGVVKGFCKAPNVIAGVNSVLLNECRRNVQAQVPSTNKGPAAAGPKPAFWLDAAAQKTRPLA